MVISLKKSKVTQFYIDYVMDYGGYEWPVALALIPPPFRHFFLFQRTHIPLAAYVNVWSLKLDFT